MTPDQLIYSTILNKCVSVGLDNGASRRAAEDGLLKYKQNTFHGKPIDLIDETVKNAKKLCKAKKKKK